jgi:hypothetical protein
LVVCCIAFNPQRPAGRSVVGQQLSRIFTPPVAELRRIDTGLCTKPSGGGLASRLPWARHSQNRDVAEKSPAEHAAGLGKYINVDDGGGGLRRSACLDAREEWNAMP